MPFNNIKIDYSIQELPDIHKIDPNLKLLSYDEITSRLSRKSHIETSNLIIRENEKGIMPLRKSVEEVTEFRISWFLEKYGEFTGNYSVHTIANVYGRWERQILYLPKSLWFIKNYIENSNQSSRIRCKNPESRSYQRCLLMKAIKDGKAVFSSIFSY